ncbi:MAG: helix-turn-helix transcriptional regulator [Corynebacterium sp.]|nr:helix-turn-helix transcriptional regulator [Corynebacterium sp.]
MGLSEGLEVYCRLAEILEERQMTLTELSDEVGVSVVNLSKLKNNHAKAIRFSTLVAICHALQCSPGDLLVVNAASTS